MQNNFVFFTAVIVLCTTLQGCGGNSKKSSSPSPTNPAPEVPTPPASPTPEDPVTQVVINEVVAKASDDGPDWVELYNPSNTEQDLSGYVLKDNNDENQFVLPSNSLISAGGYLLLQRDKTSSAGFDFGLGKADSVRLFDTEGQRVDSTQWNDGDAPVDKSWGRLPNGIGQFQTLEPPTAQSENTTASSPTDPITTNPVVINEVVTRSNDRSDWIELYNSSNTEQDLSGYVLQDNNDDNRYEIPSGTVITAGGYLVFERAEDDGTGEFDFGLGSTDSVRLFNAAGELIDSTQWTNGDAPIDKSWGRLPNGIGQFQTLEPPTPGAANSAVAEDDVALTNVRERYPEYVYDSSHASDYLFDQGQLRRYDIWLNESSLNQINSNPSKEEYVEGAMVFEDKVISRVGIRYKGQGSKFIKVVTSSEEGQLFEIRPCMTDLEEDEELAPGQTAEKSCTKISMKVKIDWNSSEAVFYGAKKLQFHAMNIDPTMMHERLGYWLFNQFDVPAPRSVHAELYINGQFNGVFALVEQLDDRFVKDRFGQNGNLYKDVWPLLGNGSATPEQIIRQGLKTNTDNADVSQFKQFADEAAQINTDYTTLGIYNAEDDAFMKKSFDIDKLLRMMVVGKTIAHNDSGMYNWFCLNEFFCINNYNMYFHQNVENNQVNIIPWDLDTAFYGLNPQRPYYNYSDVISDDWNQVSNDCVPFYPAFNDGTFFDELQRSAACDKLFGALTLYEQQFNELKQLFIEQLFNSETIRNQVDTWTLQIQDAVRRANEAGTTFNDEPSVAEWLNFVELLKQDITYSILDDDD